MVTRALNVALCIVSLLCVCATLQAQSILPSSTATVQICAEVRQLTGDPLEGLRSANFVVSDNGAPLPFRLIPIGVHAPKSVLVIVSPASGFHTLQEAAPFLGQMLPNRNRIDALAVLGPRGEYVGFQSVGRALSELKAGRYLYKGYVQAIQEDLENWQGERAILYLTNRLSNPPKDLIVHARSAGALIYAVGGDPYQNYIFSGEETQSAPLGNYTEGAGYGPVISTQAVTDIKGGGAPVWENYAARSVRAVYMEESIQKALREMGTVSKGFYEIRVDLRTPVQIIHLKPKIPGDYQLNAYTCSSSAASATRLVLAK